MKFYGTLLVVALLAAGCAMSTRANNSQVPDPDGFDKALATFQQHLNDCPYPAAHVMVFARSWNIPEFVVQAYVPRNVVLDRGKTGTEEAAAAHSMLAK
jgi:hypothetical protein